MADIGQHIGDIARIILGEPNKEMSSKTELRFGRNGSLSVDIPQGCWYDHEASVGGNVSEFLDRHGIKDGQQAAWLDKHHIGDPLRANGSKYSREMREIEAAFDYVDERGELLFQTIRFRFVENGKPVLTSDGKPKKAFSQRRPATTADDPSKAQDGWVWSVKGVRLVPYQLPDLLEAVSQAKTIFLVEGEKKADRLRAMGLSATCNPMGAGKWPEEFSLFFRGADVVILPDNDEAGGKHRDVLGAALSGVAAAVRVLDLPKLPAKGDVVDWLDAGGNADQLANLVDHKAYAWTPKVFFKLGGVWFKDAETQLPDPTWLVDDLLTEGDMSLVYGPSQSGKSFWATHVALGVARGTPVFNRKSIQGGVGYVAAEGKRGFKKRLAAYRQFNDVDHDLPFLLIPQSLNLFEGEGIDDLMNDLASAQAALLSRGHSLKLVVVDTLAAVSPGANENVSEDMSRLIENFHRIQTCFGCHVMIVHHMNAGGVKPRGHTSLYANCDNAVEVTCDETKRRVAHIIKLKDGEDGCRLGFKLQSVTIGARDDGKPITSCVVCPIELQLDRPDGDRGPALNDSQYFAFEALRAAIFENGVAAPESYGLPVPTRVVLASYWKAKFRERGFVEEPNDDNFRQAFKRAGDALMRKGYIDRKAPHVWLRRPL